MTLYRCKTLKLDLDARHSLIHLRQLENIACGRQPLKFAHRRLPLCGQNSSFTLTSPQDGDNFLN